MLENDFSPKMLSIKSSMNVYVYWDQTYKINPLKCFVFLLQTIQAAILFRRRPFLGAKPELEIETPESLPDEETVVQQKIKIKIPDQVSYLNKF